jgi:hypothetical protein
VKRGLLPRDFRLQSCNPSKLKHFEESYRILMLYFGQTVIDRASEE